MSQFDQNMNNITGILPMINQLMMQGPPQGYGGPMVAGFTPMQMAGWGQQLQGAQNYAGAGSGWGGLYGNALGQGGTAQAQQIGAQPGMDFFNNPYMDQTVQNTADAMSRNFQRNVMPTLNIGAIGSGQSGSSRHGVAQGLAASDLNRQVGDMASQQYMNMYQQGMGNFLDQRGQDIGVLQGNQDADLRAQLGNQSYQQSLYGMMPHMLGAYGQSQAAPGQAMADIGGQQQGMNQAQLNAAQQQWSGAQNANMDFMNNIIGMLSGTGGGGYTSTRASGGK